MSHQAYGPQVGVPWILDLLDEMPVPATFVLGWVAEHRPGLAAGIVERGQEVARHSCTHRAPTSLTPAEERADFERTLVVFADQGHRDDQRAPRGAVGGNPADPRAGRRARL